MGLLYALLTPQFYLVRILDQIGNYLIWLAFYDPT